MSSTVIPSSNFNVIFDAALANYREHTGVDLSQYPLADKLQNCQSADAILELLQEKVNEFKEFRNGNHKLINYLRPVVQVLHAFSVLDNVARLHLPTLDHFLTYFTSHVQAQFQPTKAVLYGVDFLLCVCISLTFIIIKSLPESCLPFQTAIAVGTSYDALAELFECVANFIGRLRIYSQIPFEPTMSGLIIRILVEVLSVLALATKQIRQGRLSTPLIS
jgi:hypothetical protein